MYDKIFIQFSEISDFIDDLSKAGNFEDVLYVFQRQIEMLGFDHFTYWVIWPMSGPRKPLYISSFRKDYSDHYTARDFKNIDPVWSQVSKQVTPFSWSEVIKNNIKKGNKKHMIVFHEARDFDIRSVGTIPLYGPGRFKGGVTITCEDEQKDFDKQFKAWIGFLQIIVNYLHEKMIKLVYEFDSVTPMHITLSAREKEILLWASKGKTNWEIAEILNISEETVKVHFRRITNKYSVVNKTQAVAHAIMNGDILP